MSTINTNLFTNTIAAVGFKIKIPIVASINYVHDNILSSVISIYPWLYGTRLIFGKYFSNNFIKT